jgi:hypothetical protein
LGPDGIFIRRYMNLLILGLFSFGGGKIGNILDPANITGGRPGGISIGDALDPGGAMVKTVTGSDIGRKIADPAKLFRKRESAGTLLTGPNTTDKKKVTLLGG